MMNIDEAMQYAQYRLESAFEEWLSSECPSGDVEQVERQWNEAFAHEELVNELQPVMALTWEVRRLRSEIDSAREDLQSFVDARNEWKQRAEAAEKALKEAQEQEPLTWETSSELMDILKNPIYASPVPAAPVKQYCPDCNKCGALHC